MAKRLTKAVARKVLQTVDAGLTKGRGIPELGRMCVEAAVCYALGLPHGDHPDCVASSLNKLKIVLNDNSWWISNKSRAKGMRKLAILQLGTAGVLDEIDFVRRLVLVAKDMAARAAEAAARAVRADARGAAVAAAAAADYAVAVASAAAVTAAAYAARADAYAARAARAHAAAAADYAVAVANAAAAAAADYAVAVANAAAIAHAHAQAARVAAYAAYATYAADARAADGAAAAAGEAELVYFADRVADILIKMKVPAVKWLDLLEE